MHDPGTKRICVRLHDECVDLQEHGDADRQSVGGHLAKILLVDDDPGVAATLAKILRAAKHDVSIASIGRDAVTRVRFESPEVVLVDYRLPDMTGLDVIRELRALGLRVSCVVITGFGTVASAVEAMKLGAVDFLEKPLDSAQLLTVIGSAASLASGLSPASSSVDGLERWCCAMVAAIRAPRDPRTLQGWSTEVHVAAETLRGWCRTANLSPKCSLDLARMLRAVVKANGARERIAQFVNIADRRTRIRLWKQAGLFGSNGRVSALQVLDAQQFIRDPAALEALRGHLRR